MRALAWIRQPILVPRWFVACVTIVLFEDLYRSWF